MRWDILICWTLLQITNLKLGDPNMHKRYFMVCASLLVLALVAGCGGGSNETNLPPPGGGAPGGAPTFDMSKAHATVTGQIGFEVTPPPDDQLQTAADPYCAQRAAQK